MTLNVTVSQLPYCETIIDSRRRGLSNIMQTMSNQLEDGKLRVHRRNSTFLALSSNNRKGPFLDFLLNFLRAILNMASQLSCEA